MNQLTSSTLTIPHRRRLFIASCLALTTTAMMFSIRAAILDDLGAHFHVGKEAVGIFAGKAFLGFAAAIMIGGPLCDEIGMGPLLAVAWFFHISGVLLTIFAPSYGVLEAATFVVGLGNGLVEGVINPLVATIYADEKTRRMNMLHAWWPGGLILGGLSAYALTAIGSGWQIKMAVALIPTIAYGVMILRQRFPATERVVSGVSAREMFSETLNPRFLLLALCMVLTATTELAPDQWMQSVLRSTANVPGILVLVYISGLMFVMRFVVVRTAENISPVSLMLACSAVSAAGLLALSYAYNIVTAFAAATVFGMGVSYFWPTMLAITSEQFPKGGALLLSLMGAIGNVAVDLALAVMGRIYDKHGAAEAFRYVAIAPVMLLCLFSSMLVDHKVRGGYKAVRLPQAGE